MMNPGKIVDPYRIDENLRLGPNYAPHQPQTHFQFPDDRGSFARADPALCRRGQMPPARRYRRTGHDVPELHGDSRGTRFDARPRSRAVRNAPWKRHRGRMARRRRKGDARSVPRLARVARETAPSTSTWPLTRPSSFRIIGKAGLRPRSAYAFGWIDKWAHAASLAPGFVNLITQLPVRERRQTGRRHSPSAHNTRVRPEDFSGVVYKTPRLVRPEWWTTRDPVGRHVQQLLLSRYGDCGSESAPAANARSRSRHRISAADGRYTIMVSSTWPRTICGAFSPPLALKSIVERPLWYLNRVVARSFAMS